MTGGYTETVKNKGETYQYNDVVFDEAEQQKIIDFFNNNKNKSAPQIRDALFNGMDEKSQGNAAYKIQRILDQTPYTGN